MYIYVYMSYISFQPTHPNTSPWKGQVEISDKQCHRLGLSAEEGNYRVVVNTQVSCEYSTSHTRICNKML